MTTRKEDARARSLELAADCAIRGHQALAEGERRRAEAIIVHAYHQGARPLDIIEAWIDARG